MPKRRPAKNQNRRRISWKGRLAFWLGLFGTLVFAFYWTWARLIPVGEVDNIPDRSAVFDMDGSFYSRFRGENRLSVPLEKVSPHFVNALLAREDSRFYKHHGVDPIGIARAMVRNLIRLSVREGASTLTQQLARNSFVLGGRNLHRKLLEAFVAWRIEDHYSKKEILELYINRIYFGSGYWGIETASQAYFGRRAKDLNLSQSAMLVGLIRSPTRFSPFNNPDGAHVQRDAVLDRMVKLKMISAETATEAKASRVAIAKKRSPIAQENYAMDTVRQEVDVLLSEEQLEQGGLRIYTTIDPKLQAAAEKALESRLGSIEQQPGWRHPTKASYNPAEEESETPYLQGALIAIDNRSGGIRAIVGGRDYRQSRYNRALLSPRQVGSTFKPFVYAAAFHKGLSPDTPIDDGPIRPSEAHSNWSPANSDGTNRGILPAREGLVQSRNTMTVRVGNAAGLDSVRSIGKASGLGDLPRFPSIYLGAFEATLKDVTAAYTIFPNEGVRRQTYIIERIDDQEGKNLYRAAHITAPAIPRGAALSVNSVLQQVLDRGTAAKARSLGFKKAGGGKTGTTNDFRDAWFIGYTKSLTCGVWVGLDRPATIANQGYGATLALPVWADLMNAASEQRYPASRIGGDSPDGVPTRFMRSVRKLFGG